MSVEKASDSLAGVSGESPTSKTCSCRSSSPTRSGAKDEDLFDWDHKAKDARQSNGAGAKRKRGTSKESKPQRKKKAPGPHALSLHVNLCAATQWLNSLAAPRLAGKVSNGAIVKVNSNVVYVDADKREAISNERASASPNLATAPHDGPDEPLLLHHDPSDGA